MEKNKKTILEELVRVDIRFLQKKRCNSSLCSSFQNLRTGDFVERVATTTTPCFFGGERYWFLCPLCSKRVAILYQIDSFGCRNCHNLMYASQALNRRSQYFPLLRVLELGRRIQQLEANIGRRLYAGEPTKKQLLLTSLQEASMRIGILFL